MYKISKEIIITGLQYCGSEIYTSDVIPKDTLIGRLCDQVWGMPTLIVSQQR